MRLLFLLAALTACGGGATVVDGALKSKYDGGILTDGNGVSCDCQGVELNNLCLNCPDGTKACNHYVCDAGQCFTQICE